MKRFSKIILVILTIIYIVCSLLIYKGTRGIDNLAYTIAMGIDKGSSSKYNISFQFTKPSSGKDSSSSSSSTSSFVYNVESDTIPTAMNLMNSYLSKQVNLAHCKAIVFSEEIASNGISGEIYTLINNIQVRPDASIIISKCKAVDFIKNTEPDLESSVSQYYEITPVSNENTGFTDNVTIGNFYGQLCSKTRETYAILGNLDKIKDSSSSSSNKESESGTQYKQQPGTETIGLAIFKDDKLVGELGAIENICHLIVTNNLSSTTISIPSPHDSSNSLDLYIYKNKRNTTKVEFINGSPYVTVNCKLHARISSVDEDNGYTSEETINTISNIASKYLEKNITSYLYKISKIYNADIAGIGNHAVNQFSTNSKWNNFNWKNNFQNCFFKVNVSVVVKSGYLLTET